MLCLSLLSADALMLIVSAVLEQNINLAHLQPKTQMMIEILLVTAILTSQKGANGSEKTVAARQKEGRLLRLFTRPKEMPELAQGMQYFLKKVVRKTDLVANKEERDDVRLGCKVADSALTRLLTMSA